MTVTYIGYVVAVDTAELSDGFVKFKTVPNEPLSVTLDERLDELAHQEIRERLEERNKHIDPGSHGWAICVRIDRLTPIGPINVFSI